MANLQIIISALNKASGDINKVKSEIKGVGDSGKDAQGGVKGFGSSLTSVMGTAAMVTGAVVAVGAAIKEVYNTAKEGAALEYAASKFDRLAASVGTTSDVLLGDLKAATGGMISDAELMASASDMMSLGLANSHDEVVRLATVAGGLNMNMNQLVLTLTNKTTMRFDALGVSVAGFDEKVKALEASGLSADEAFSEAFLQQAEEQINKVGKAADSAIAPVQQMEAAFKNLSDAAKLRLAGSFDGLAVSLTEVANSMVENEQAGARLGDVMSNLDGLLAAGSIDRQTYNTFLHDMGIHSNAGAVSLDKVTEAEARLDLISKSTGQTVDMTAESLIAQSIATKQAEEANKNAAVAQRAVTDATNDADAAMRSYSESLLFKIASEGLSADAAYNLAVAMGLVDKNTVAATEQVNVYKQMLDAGQITQAQYNLLVKDLADDIENLPEGHTLEIDDNIDAVKSDLAGLETWKMKPIPIKLNLDTSAVDNYHPPRITGTVTYAPANQYFQAVGGAVQGGVPYTWQEYGYRGELFVPSADGFILSRADAERALSKALAGGISGEGIDADAVGKAVADALMRAGGGKGGNVYNLTMPTSSNPADVRTAFELMEAWA